MNLGTAVQLRHRQGLTKAAPRVAQIAIGAVFVVAIMPRIAFGDEVTNANPAPPAPAPSIAPTAAQTAQAPSASSSLKTDHEVIVGAIGLGYIGSYQVALPIAVPVGRGDQAGMFPNDEINLRQILVPTLGLRKWFTRRYGVEVGLGVSLSAGGTSAKYGDASATVDKESIFAISVHAGIPVMVVDTRHMAFLIVPETTLSMARSSIKAEFEENAPPDAEMRGGKLDAGLRAGAELHFGFMGLPRLSLQAGVGVYFTAQWASATVANQSITDTSMSVGFGSAGEPWSIFSGVANMSARYYF